MPHKTFFENIARDKPSLAIKYMAHLAAQIQGDGIDSARSQAVDGRITGDYDAIARACDREEALRSRFTQLSASFFHEYGVVGMYGNDCQARAIFDLV